MDFRQFTNITINGQPVIQLQVGSSVIWKKGSEPTPIVDYAYQVARSFADLTTDDNIDYSYVYNDSKWYALNNLKQYEPWGVYEETDDINSITKYNGKLAILNGDTKYEYQYLNGQWSNVGEIQGGGLDIVCTLSSGMWWERGTVFPTNFQVKKEQLGMGFFPSMNVPNLNVSISYSDWDKSYSIMNNDSGEFYEGEVTEDDEWVYFTNPYEGKIIPDSVGGWYPNSVDIYADSITIPIKYDKTIFDDYSLYQGYPYNSLEEIPHVGKGVIYNIDGYLYKDNERTTVNPYNLEYGQISGTPITEIKLLDENITSLGMHAFRQCYSLTSVTIGSSLKTFRDYTFQECNSLSRINSDVDGVFIIPDTVTDIATHTFWGCTSLTSITLSNSLTTLGKNVFLSCSRLKSIDMPNSVTTIGQSAFNGVPTTGTLTCYKSWYEGLTSTNKTNLGNVYNWTKVYEDEPTPPEPTSNPTVKITFLDETERIDTYEDGIVPSSQYSNQQDIKSVDFGDGIITIGGNAVLDCSGLTSVTIADTVTSIGDGAFARCVKLESIIIPDSVTSIGASIFQDSNGLKSVVLGKSLSKINTAAFARCTKLTSITYNGTKVQFNSISKGSNWKLSVPSSCIVHCTDGDYPITNF